VLVEDEAVPGIILRPKIENYVPIVPPCRRDGIRRENLTSVRQIRVSIPFYGAYWFLRASEENDAKPLPSELRGRKRIDRRFKDNRPSYDINGWRASPEISDPLSNYLCKGS